MAGNSQNIFVGSPDKIVGACKRGPLTAAAPTGTTGAQTGFTDSGYISEAGLTITPNETTTTIRDWNGDKVREFLSQFDGTLAWAFLETNQAAVESYFGVDNVDVTPAEEDSGTLMTMRFNGLDRPHESRIFNIKDGSRKAVIYAPDCQVTTRGALTLTRNAAWTWPVTCATFPDELGNHLYIFTDDGVFAA